MSNGQVSIAGASVRAVVESAGGDGCGVVDEPRFFRPWMTLSSDPPFNNDHAATSLGLWRAFGYELVHAPVAVTFSPFGPGGPQVDLAKGYSWLRRACSPDGVGLTMDTAPAADTVTFKRDADDGTDRFDVFGFEGFERDFVQGCGVSPPAVEIGRRVSFDHATHLLWSSDDGTVFYLSAPTSLNRPRISGIRSIKVDGTGGAEIAATTDAQDLAIDNASELYVLDDAGWQHVVRGSDRPAIFQTVPVPGNAILSPDGHWFAYRDKQDATNVWDLQATQVGGSFAGAPLGWTADSALITLKGSTTVVS
ncbi:MAG: hypothetical protein QOI66_735, partial [Myxococcales bacterium]|nr:hypothetical protein [Myxococcales bacterium]